MFHEHMDTVKVSYERWQTSQGLYQTSVNTLTEELGFSKSSDLKKNVLLLKWLKGGHRLFSWSVSLELKEIMKQSFYTVTESQVECAPERKLVLPPSELCFRRQKGLSWLSGMLRPRSWRSSISRRRRRKFILNW